VTAAALLGCLGIAAAAQGVAGEAAQLFVNNAIDQAVVAARNITLEAVFATTTGVFAVLALLFWAEPRGGLLKAIKNAVGGSLVVIPGIKGLVDAEMKSMMAELEKSMIGEVAEKDRIRKLPAKGMPADRMLAVIDAAAAKDKAHWSSGKLSGTIYHGGDNLSEIISVRRRGTVRAHRGPTTAPSAGPSRPAGRSVPRRFSFAAASPARPSTTRHPSSWRPPPPQSAISKFALSNPLHPSSFPSLRKMDAEVVAMTMSLFHPTETTCGTTTSGGTESILLACLAYRDHARKTRGVVDPEMILPLSAHAAFDKAAHYFGIKVVAIPVDPVTFRVNPADVQAAVTSNTVMIVGSAPQFPQGVVDPIP